jgi:hypothetical protein
MIVEVVASIARSAARCLNETINDTDRARTLTLLTQSIELLTSG